MEMLKELFQVINLVVAGNASTGVMNPHGLFCSAGV